MALDIKPDDPNTKKYLERTEDIILSKEDNYIKNDPPPTFKKKLSLAFYNKGLIFLRREEYQKVIDNCTLSIKIDNKEESYYNRGTAYYYLGELTKALEDFETVLKLNPNESGAKFFIKSIKKELNHK
jgi:tetratricopeptide (TPR) repeat protein